MSTTEILILVGTHIAAFVAGALVFRNNEKAANKIIDAGQTAAKDANNIIKKA